MNVLLMRRLRVVALYKVHLLPALKVPETNGEALSTVRTIAAAGDYFTVTRNSDAIDHAPATLTRLLTTLALR
jgi:hypothetical protein